ncbi:MAG: hypothetical protein NUV61_02100 [Candidatus Azambacteria bacterium]|nr:hypothetical protein [Candidatus Azambacteria bacterium]
MILPKKVHTKFFQTYSKEDFRKWLFDGLTGYQKKSRDEWIFEPLALFMGQDESISHDLRNIYKVLPSEKCRKNFCAAMKELIVSTRNMLEGLDDLEWLLEKEDVSKKKEV